MILDSISHVLPGCLPASFRGVSFFVPDASTEAGRRVAESLFPGVDRAAYDDLGLHPAVISLEGIMVGDDYALQARALQAAFERPGPGTLIHPWLGVMTVILEEPGEISFSATELRVARFSATFKRVTNGAGSFFSGTAAGLLSIAASFVITVLSLASSSSSTISRVGTLAAQRSSRLVAREWQALPAGPASSAISAAFPPAAAADPVALSATISAITDAVMAMVPAMQGDAAVGPAAEAAPATASLAPSEAVDLFLTASARIFALQADAPSTVDRVMLLAAAGEPIGKAASMSVYIAHRSREDALALRATLTSAIDRFAEAAGDIEDMAFTAAASLAIRSALDLRARVVADINEMVGRLPALVIVNTEIETDAFAMANRLYGDRPETIEAGYRSIVERNRPRHPAQLPAGRIEALK